jgi:glycosyltransferase involved in cell wall biosynthesis
LREQLKSEIQNRNIPNVQFLGFVDEIEKKEMMGGASFLVVPSQCYENFPRIIVEAFSYGIPVVASRLGSLAEIVEEGKVGSFSYFLI